MRRHPRSVVASRRKPQASAVRRASAARDADQTSAAKPAIARVRDGLVLRVVRKKSGTRSHADERRAR